MIQEYLTKLCRETVPSLRWSTDFYALEDNTGTVYAEAGSPPRLQGEVDMRYPSYMIYIRSSNWDLAKQATEQVRDDLHRRTFFHVLVPQYDADGQVAGERSFFVYFLTASTEPIRLGPDENNVMEYSINFDASIKEE